MAFDAYDPTGGFWLESREFSIVSLPSDAEINFNEFVAETVREDLKSAERNELIKYHGNQAMDYHE